MSKLSTKDVKTGGGFTPKNIEPGNMKARIFKIDLDQPQFLVKDEAFFLQIHLESEKPNDDFEGFLLDADDESKGRFEGQTGRVKSSRWSFRDFTTKAGTLIERDQEILKFIKNLCESLGIMDWWNKADEQYATIELFVEAFNNDAPFKNIWLNWCVGGRQYVKQNGYKGWDLHLPKFSKEGIPFEQLTPVKSRLLEFDADEHTEVTQPKPVDDFAADADPIANVPADLPADDDLPAMEDAPEFEL